MIWTKEFPTVEGLYLYAKSGHIVLVDVTTCGLGLFENKSDDDGAMWFGPITLP